MAENHYKIGDLARLSGLSTDSLRHYEKKGILSPVREENGYRHYTDADIRRMAGILTLRKMDLGLEEIGALSSGLPSEHVLSVFEKQREFAAKEMIRQKRNLLRIDLVREELAFLRWQEKNGKTQSGRYQHHPFPFLLALCECSSQDESVEQWFSHAVRYDGLDMIRLFDEYAVEKTSGWKLTYIRTILAVRKDIIPYIDYDDPEEHPECSWPENCVSSVFASAERTPDQVKAAALLKAAEKLEGKAPERFFASGIMDLAGDDTAYWLHCYVPVS